jgi:hypothetical protein
MDSYNLYLERSTEWRCQDLGVVFLHGQLQLAIGEVHGVEVPGLVIVFLHGQLELVLGEVHGVEVLGLGVVFLHGELQLVLGEVHGMEVPGLGVLVLKHSAPQPKPFLLQLLVVRRNVTKPEHVTEHYF